MKRRSTLLQHALCLTALLLGMVACTGSPAGRSEASGRKPDLLLISTFADTIVTWAVNLIRFEVKGDTGCYMYWVLQNIDDEDTGDFPASRQLFADGYMCGQMLSGRIARTEGEIAFDADTLTVRRLRYLPDDDPFKSRLLHKRFVRLVSPLTGDSATGNPADTVWNEVGTLYVFQERKL